MKHRLDGGVKHGVGRGIVVDEGGTGKVTAATKLSLPLADVLLNQIRLLPIAFFACMRSFFLPFVSILSCFLF